MITTLLLTSMFACGDKDSDTGFEDTGTVDTDPTDTDETDTEEETDTEAPPVETVYKFENADGESSVSYSGQIFRHLLIHDVKAYVSGLEGRLATSVMPPGLLSTEMDFYYNTIKDADVSRTPHYFSNSDFGLVQENYGDVSSGKNIFGKIAGNDTATDHKDWSTEFVGWDQPGVTSPESLVLLWTNQLDELAAAWDGTNDYPVYVTADGQDIGQLLQKFMLGAVAFSQGADDYMDDDVEGKGLLASHIPDEGKAYSGLEHAWDEAFGYFGAAQDYSSWTDDEIASNASLDRNEDGLIDLKTEVSWGHSRNAGKRDVGSNDPSVDLTADAWNAFYEGRRMLSSSVGAELSDADLDTLRGYRDEAIGAWEMAIVATTVHYINDTLQDINNEASLTDLAKHWSEMKGFALSMQFNPNSSLSDSEFLEVHNLMGIRPNRTSDYAADLVEARTILGNAYRIDGSNLGDADGENGW